MSMKMPTQPADGNVIFNDVTMGYLVKDVAGSTDIILSDAEAQNAMHEYTGGLAANIIVAVPAETKAYWIFNNTSGAFTLSISPVGFPGNSVTITQGTKVLIGCDGSNCYAWTAEI